MEDYGEDEASQGEADWQATELVSCSLELETKIFPRPPVTRDCIVGITEPEFLQIIAFA